MIIIEICMIQLDKLLDIDCLEEIVLLFVESNKEKKEWGRW